MPLDHHLPIRLDLLSSLNRDLLRLNAGLDAPGKALGGWEDPKVEVRGQFMGHWLSGTAMLGRNTGEAWQWLDNMLRLHWHAHAAFCTSFDSIRAGHCSKCFTFQLRPVNNSYLQHLTTSWWVGHMLSLDMLIPESAPTCLQHLPWEGRSSEPHTTGVRIFAFAWWQALAQTIPIDLCNSNAGNKAVLDKAETMIKELRKVQQALGGEYLSAFPTEHFDRLRSLQAVWAPFYVVSSHNFCIHHMSGKHFTHK